MTIAIQKGQEQLKQHLLSRGYNVVTYGEYTGIIDALLYTETPDETALSSGNFKQTAGTWDTPAYGIFMLNISGKSMDEIERILNRRLYTPLFE